MNAMLARRVTDMEIETTLFQMGPTKALGHNGLPALFYHKHWHLVKFYVCCAVREFIEGKVAPECFNDTVIVMIRKINSPELLMQFRPISLCNVLYCGTPAQSNGTPRAPAQRSSLPEHGTTFYYHRNG